MVALLSLSPAALAEALGGDGRAQAVYAVLREGGDPFTSDALAPGAKRRLSEAAGPTVLEVSSEIAASDGTVKQLVTLSDGRAIEIVAIPTDDRTTLCVSSQVGCARACTFCLTATMGLVRSLSADEIAGQVVLGLRLVRARNLPVLRNVVFMGMGEPLDNIEEVKRALDVIAGSRGLGIGPRHVTVSTVGPSVEKIAALSDMPARVAWSLHSADEEVRQKLVPTARATPTALKDALAAVLGPKREPLFVEITMIDGVNDGPHDARKVVELLADFPTEVRVNLLPVNPTERGHLPSKDDAIDAFREVLMGAGLLTLTRRARGADERSACGQLAIDGLGRRR